MSASYIELERTFHELSLKGGDRDEFDYRTLKYGNKLVWNDLLSGHRTVLLSEAGSGKTEEIRHAAQSMCKEGKSAFFLRLEHVADDFDIAFEEGDLSGFEQWLASTDEGWLFLDSVDEARLREPKDFERAVRKIGVRLAGALQRTHIIITSRGTAWRPVTDLKLCEQHLRYVVLDKAAQDNGVGGRSDGSDDSAYRIVALDDLSKMQIATFATAKGISDTKPFLDAIERAEAWSMAARPDDLTELVEFWFQKTRIGNRLELMQSSLARRLAERDQGRAEAMPLSIANAQMGARSVAAASTMAQESTIRVPDGTENTVGLSVASVLPGWDDRKCAALLARPIFDEAIYRTVRFHHRTVREYLTAEWFKGLLERETSRRKIEALFFREQYGLEVIVPAMRPVLVWLILLDDKIRDRALTISPELVFEGGEPKALPLGIRQKILREVCETMHRHVTRSGTTDYRAVQRFADHDIAADVKALLAEYEADNDLQWFLLRMVWQGELSECLPEAKSAALNRKTSRFTRVAALRAVLAVGSPADHAEVRARFLTEAAMLDREVFGELLTGLSPDNESVEWVLACLAKLKAKGRNSTDGLRGALDDFVRTLDLDLLPPLVMGMNNLLSKRPIVERRFCEISKRYGWIIKSAAQAAERLIVVRHPAALDVSTLSILQKLPSAQHYRDWDLREIQSDIPKLVPAWTELNDALFWFDVSQARRYRQKRHKERVTEIWQVSLFGSYWRFSSEDFGRILGTVNFQAKRDDQLVALSLAFKLYAEGSRPSQWRQTLKSAAAPHAALRAALQKYLHPGPLTKEQKEWRRQDQRYKRQQNEREARDTERDRKWKIHLSEHVDKLRNHGLPDPTVVTNHQHYLHERMRELDSDSSHWTNGNWQLLEAEFGAEVALAFRDGAVRFWRFYKPKLRSEGKTGNSTPFGVIFGLTGLNIEARETENWPSTLSEQDGDTAFRYAMDELNGFPDWLPSLFAASPAAITERLLREVDRDLRVGTAKIEPHYVLSDLSWSGSWAWCAIGPGILARLTDREPRNLSSLNHILNILHGADIQPERIAALAELRSTDRRLDHASQWFAVWVGTDPGNAIPALAARLEAIKPPSRQTLFAMRFITRLLGGRRGEVRVGDGFRTPDHLKSLYLLMHYHVREKEDIQRAGKGSYSPGLRDDAQDARNQLFSLLKEIPGKEAFLALMELTSLHPEPSSRPWMLHHARTKAEVDADLSPWTVDQTLEFQTLMERTPSNHRELFELTKMRFLDLKDNLERGDSSIAGILLKGATLETEMRTYIGDWLRERAQNRYSVPQEEELADAKRMDLRLHGHGFDGPVPAELKLADKWTGAKLFERLENQLCGDYLRDNRSSRGFFVLVHRGEKQSWEMPATGETMNFEALVKRLQEHWLAISNRFPNVDEIHVIGIDLTQRKR